MMAVMMVASATAFAGDSDALKAILKAKTYAEAEALVKSSVGSLANDAEKAKAYNKLVDLAYEAFNKQSTIQTENQLAKQMGREEKPVDEALMIESAYNAIVMALECNKYDQKPNEKNKVAPKFAAKNALRLWTQARNQVFNAGQDAAKNNNDSLVLKYWGLFVDSYNDPLFEKERKGIDAMDEKTKVDQYSFIGQVAYFAGVQAQKAGNLVKAREYFSLTAENEYVDKDFKNDANNKILLIMREGMKDKADTLRVLEEYKKMYSQKPDDDLLMNAIFVIYNEMKDKANMNSLLDARLAKDPKNYMALANKGLMAMDENNADEAIKYLTMASEVEPTNAVVKMYIGICLNAKASQTADTDPVKAKEIFKQAIDVFDKCKELDPDKLNAKWGYNRYQAYYNYYGENAPETKQAEQESH